MPSPLVEFDEALRREGHVNLCGVDEAGRGPLAGPVVAAAVILDPRDSIEGLNDSKKLSPRKRGELFALIFQSRAKVGVGVADAAEIDRTDILAATLSAMRRAVEATGVAPDFVLVDGNRRITGLAIAQNPVVKGDGLSASIAAASIVAKEHRDKLMDEYDGLYPGYGFAVHAGYPTASHLEAIARLGPCPIHRRTFRGVREHVPSAPKNGCLFPS